VADPDQAFGGQSNKETSKILHLFKYPSFSATIIGYHRKVVIPFLGQENGYFGCLDCAIFQGITTV